MTALHHLPNDAARRIFLDRHGLAGVTGGSGRGDDIAGVIHDLGFVQVDSVNTFARAHDLILWSRRRQYRPAALDTLRARRAVFEHWTHDAAVVPMAFWPHWRMRFARDKARLASRWAEWRRGDFMAQADAVLKRISDHGPCGSSDVGEGEKKGSGGWWDWHPSKTALEYLWRSGELSVCHRAGFRKIYDLTERVVPDTVRARHIDEAESLDWFCDQAINRLGFATHGEIAAFWDHLSPAEVQDWCSAEAAAGRLEMIALQTATGASRKVWARPGLLDQTPPDVAGPVRILSPFDPALRDRKRAEALFGFHYRIEIFVPEAKRRYGYYVFPVWEGTRAIGRIDMKRADGTLAVRAFWPEPGVRMGSGRRARLMTELERAARFGGCNDISFAPDWLRDAG